MKKVTFTLHSMRLIKQNLKLLETIDLIPSKCIDLATLEQEQIIQYTLFSIAVILGEP